MEVLAVSWMTPVKPSGSPTRRRSQSRVTCSSSVAAGAVCHDITLVARTAATISASTAGGLALAGKYAIHPGCCQCVMPGITSASKSFQMAANGSAASGASGGRARRRSPGATAGVTRRASTDSR